MRESAGQPSESMMLEAIEVFDDAAFAAFVEGVADPSLAAQLRRMRADRGVLIAAKPEPAPVRLGTSAIDEALEAGSGGDASGLAELEAAAQPIGGVPASKIPVYRESLSMKLWRYRGAAGVGLAAALVLVCGLAINAGVQAWNARGSRTIETPGAVALGTIDTGNSMGAPSLALPAVVDDPEELRLAESIEPPASWGAVALADVFEAAPHLGSGRLLVCARSGSAARTADALAALGTQTIGIDHSFTVRGALGDDALAAIGMPEAMTPVVAMDELDANGQPVIAAPILAERSAAIAEVRPTAAALAALRKRLEEAGMVVEFRLLGEPLDAALLEEADTDADRSEETGDGDGSTANPPAAARGRRIVIPVLIDSIPG